MELPAANPFDLWGDAIDLNEKNSIRESSNMFARASQSFFEFGSSIRPIVGRACFEYSTLMDSFSRIQKARLLRLELQYDDSLREFGVASEILRATVHFGFLSAYESACATLETASELDEKTEAFEAFRNAIALFEQSKLALGLRDELHPTIRVIDSMIKYSISMALYAESSLLADKGKSEEARKKAAQSELVKKEFLSLAGNRLKSINYFPVNDWSRAKKSGFIVSYPESNSMWFGNIGSNPVSLEAAGETKTSEVLNPFETMTVSAENLGKGRIRIVYRDLKEKITYDEGCVLMI
ncbi:MAG: hypothetical protein JRN15_24055 [Nitrososphaerota archaeon]|nr:hypothetical protein [Nitrososphaerota archaeon]